MRRNSLMLVMIMEALMLPLIAVPAHAAIQTLTGTISVLSTPSTTGNIPGVVDIVLNVSLPATGCPGGTRGFEFDSTSVTDAQTRNNMLALLAGAKFAGATVSILYDDGSANCSVHGFAVPYSIQLD